jgi:hypothetical protein
MPVMMTQRSGRKAASQPAQEVPPKPKRHAGVSVTMRLPVELLRAYAAEADRRSIATGRHVSPQAVMLETLTAGKPATRPLPYSPFAKGVLSALSDAERGYQPGFCVSSRPEPIK